MLSESILGQGERSEPHQPAEPAGFVALDATHNTGKKNAHNTGTRTTHNTSSKLHITQANKLRKIKKWKNKGL